MGTRKIVPLRPARKEGATDAPTPLTLADVTISHVFRDNKEVTLSGAEVAAILEGTKPSTSTLQRESRTSWTPTPCTSRSWASPKRST
jgi:hypothetical protein